MPYESVIIDIAPPRPEFYPSPTKMTSQSELEIKGSFFTHSFAELLAEIGVARLSGSLRITNKEWKSVVYFKSGRVVFAVSNARSSRLYDILLRRERLTRAELGQIPDFTNDIQFAAILQEKGLLTKDECDRLFVEQIEAILVDILGWESGDWIFSSLARIRDGLVFDIEATRLLVAFGRCIPDETVLKRFRSLDEEFTRSETPPTDFDLTPEEAFVLSRADEGRLSAAGLVSVAAMSDVEALHLIYTLWLGGALIRDNWQAAFGTEVIRAMRTTKLELRTEAKVPVVVGASPASPTPERPAKITPVVTEGEAEVAITLEAYLARVEGAETHYDILGVDSKAEISELKSAYFGLAKMFHPDKYHAVGGELLARVQRAFTELAQAHEVLKTPESREVYDYRMRKELIEREKRRAAGNPGLANLDAERAADNFERGFSLLMDDDFEAALPFLARAVHFAPKNARYHAYFGKALSNDKAQRHKAEAEMQAAVRLEPHNATFRLLLAEFFIQYNLVKRAEGELTRLLAAFPDNREAWVLLGQLRA